MGLLDKKLSDLTVGDVAKGYAVYWVVGGIASVIAAIIMFSVFNAKTKDFDDGFGFPGSGDPMTLETSPSVHKVTRTEYRVLETGTSKDAVLERFGEAGGTGTDIYDQTAGASKDCLVYSRASNTDKSYLLCFDGREKLITKRGI